MAEQDAVSHLIQSSAKAGEKADPISIANLYVSLRSKPLAILTGPAHSGKSETIQGFAQTLTGGDAIRCQMMNGHPWWAETSGDVCFFVEAQTRFNSAKLLAVMEEAWQPENAKRVFVACLTHISPAELIGYFTDVAFQLRHNRIMRLPHVHLVQPVPFPRNLLLIGTMDTSRVDWSDEDLLSQTTIIQWRETEKRLAVEPDQIISGLGESEFLGSLVRNEAAACRKLHHILGNEQQALRPFLEVVRLLSEQKIRIPGSVTGETLIYLANSWTKGGIGLFDRDTSN
ncbi:MAG: hypothetical protein IT323_22780, partial [Anaerolineae bacterium]|nr:hypothetical protein [Anaerolineae bacterium]